MDELQYIQLPHYPAAWRPEPLRFNVVGQDSNDAANELGYTRVWDEFRGTWTEEGCFLMEQMPIQHAEAMRKGSKRGKAK